jgi:hypothetical protein
MQFFKMQASPPICYCFIKSAAIKEAILHCLECGMQQLLQKVYSTYPPAAISPPMPT